jgi:hypothetical protein
MTTIQIVKDLQAKHFRLATKRKQTDRDFHKMEILQAQMDKLMATEEYQAYIDGRIERGEI